MVIYDITYEFWWDVLILYEEICFCSLYLPPKTLYEAYHFFQMTLSKLICAFNYL